MTDTTRYTFGSHDGRDYLIPEPLWVLWDEMDETELFIDHPRWNEIAECKIGGVCNYFFTQPEAFAGFS